MIRWSRVVALVAVFSFPVGACSVALGASAALGQEETTTTVEETTTSTEATTTSTEATTTSTEPPVTTTTTEPAPPEAVEPGDGELSTEALQWGAIAVGCIVVFSLGLLVVKVR